jgi:hypothetical protein
MQQAVNMPCWMGCLCMNGFSARNIVRYQYRIAGDDNHEVAIPYALATIEGWIKILPFKLGIISFFADVVVTMQLLSENEYRKNDYPVEIFPSRHTQKCMEIAPTGGRYLTRYREVYNRVGEEGEGLVQNDDIVGRNMEIESNRFT